MRALPPVRAVSHDTLARRDFSRAERFAVHVSDRDNRVGVVFLSERAPDAVRSREKYRVLITDALDSGYRIARGLECETFPAMSLPRRDERARLKTRT